MQILSLGATYILAAVMRVLKIMDDNGDGKLDKSELKWGLKDYGIVLSNAELDHVFSYFDRDRSGTIDRDEFLAGLRGPLSARRLGFIRQAFAIVDKSGDGVVTVDDLKGTYDCSQHPEVKVSCSVLYLRVSEWCM